MISYEIYKLIHVASIITFISFLGISLFTEKGANKLIGAGIGLFSLLILASGMGLMKRFGVPHGGPWPVWIQGKLIAWFVLSLGGAFWSARIPLFRKSIFFVLLAIAIITAFLAIFKPV